MRVYDFAKSNDISNPDAVALLREVGVEVKSVQSSISDEDAAKAKAHFLEKSGRIRRGGKALMDPVAAADFAAQLSAKWSVSLGTRDIGDALRQSDLVPQEALTVDKQQSAIRGLVDLGDLPSDALKEVDVSVKVPGRRPRGTALIRVPAGDTREKTLTDQETLDWLMEVIAADRELRTADKIFKPHFEQSKTGDGVLYEDPLSRFLEPSEFGRRGPKGENSSNWIYIGLEKLNAFIEEETSFQWRSNELLRKVQNKLFSLWCAHQFCRGCHDPLTSGVLRDDAKRVLREELVLPGTPAEQEPGSRVLRFPEFHPWCRDFRHGRIRLEVELQDIEASSEEITALRTSKLVQLASDVALKNAEYGVDRQIVMRAFRANVRVLSQIGAE
jgi:hypothetical protein